MPGTGSRGGIKANAGTRSLQTTDAKTAAELLQRIILTGKLELTADDTKVSITNAIKAYQEFKQKRSDDTKRKIKLLTHRLQTFLEGRGLVNIAGVKLPDLSAFRDTWSGAATTQRRDQEILKSFFWFCYHSDFLTKNPVIHLDPISVNRPKTEPFTHDEQIAICVARLPGRVRQTRNRHCLTDPSLRLRSSLHRHGDR
jgi:hypothetical protein